METKLQRHTVHYNEMFHHGFSERYPTYLSHQVFRVYKKKAKHPFLPALFSRKVKKNLFQAYRKATVTERYTLAEKIHWKIQPCWEEKHLRIHKMSNLVVDGFQQQNITSGSTHINQEPKATLVTVTVHVVIRITYWPHRIEHSSNKKKDTQVTVYTCKHLHLISSQ